MDSAQTTSSPRQPEAPQVPANSPVKAGYLSRTTISPVLSPAVEGADSRPGRPTTELIYHSNLTAHVILYRGFNLKTPDDFEKTVTAIYPNLFGGYGDLPREGVSDKIDKSTPYPANQAILFHNESSCLSAPGGSSSSSSASRPRRRAERPRSSTAGRLPRPRSRGLPALRRQGPDVRQELLRGHRRELQDFFKTKDKKRLSGISREEGGMTCEWVKGRTLRIKQAARAVSRHPVTKEIVFFNQVQLHHPYCLDWGDA